MSATEPEPELRDTSGWSVGLVNATCALASSPRYVRAAAFTPATAPLTGRERGCHSRHPAGARGSGR